MAPTGQDRKCWTAHSCLHGDAIAGRCQIGGYWGYLVDADDNNDDDASVALQWVPGARYVGQRRREALPDIAADQFNGNKES